MTNTWMFNGKKYTMVRKNESEQDDPRVYGKNSYTVLSYNCICEVSSFLGKKKLKVVEREKIPEHILIEIGCFGSFNPSNWSPKIFKLAQEKYGMPESFQS